MKIPLELFIEANTPKFSKMSFISNYNGSYDENIDDKGDKIRLLQINDFIGMVNIDFENKKYIVHPKLAGIVLSAHIIYSVFNNRTNQEPVENYEITMKKAIDGKIIKAKFCNEDIANDRLFIGKLGVLSTLSYDEIKEFISKFVLKNAQEEVIQLKNAGRMSLGELAWIWENCAYYNKHVFHSDKNDNIDIGCGTYYRIDKNTKKALPKYIPNKKPIADILSELFDNEWSN